jgi:hypothetical protein
MPDIADLPSSGTFTGAQLRGTTRALVADRNQARQSRKIEWFGAASVDFNATPTNNATAFVDAVEWCAETGGEVILGAGDYGVVGPVPLMSYANFRGADKMQSRVRLLTSGSDFFTSVNSPTASIYGCRFRDFAIIGPWAVNWNDDLTTAANFAAIRLAGRDDGPNDPIAFTREGVSYLSDPHHVVENIAFDRIFGDAINLSGRGEMQIRNNKIRRTARHGIFCSAPDNWFANNTVETTGATGVYMSAGNNRLMNEKYWFCGMQRFAQTVGAGLEIVGAGTANIVCTNVTTQDTWGPGLVAEGDSLIFSGNVDEAGGGRLEQQGFGWQGTRTLTRSFIRINDLTKARIVASVNGGDRRTEKPVLVDIASSGARYNEVDLYTEGAVTTTARVRVASGNSNAKRYNVVRENGRYRIGRLTTAQISDATHGIQADGPDIVPMDPSGLAVRSTDGTWSVMDVASTITPA